MRLKKCKLLGSVIAIIVFTIVGCRTGALSSDENNNSDGKLNVETNGELSEIWYKESTTVQEYFATRDVSVQKINIDNTYTEDREHKAYVHIEAKNDVASLSAEYTITSKKYDDGQWQVTDIKAEDDEAYMPLADPKINISYDDSEVVVTSTKTEDQGDDIRFVVYYNRVFDGSVARVEESYYKDYFWDKENSNDWITYNLDDECLGGKCELVDISCRYERLSQNQKDIATIGIISKDGKITIDEFEATLNRNGAWYSKCDIELLDDYAYNDIELSIEEWQSHNARVAKSPCDMDYTYEFKLYNADDKRNVTSILFVTPDELWLVIYSDGQHKICII